MLPDDRPHGVEPDPQIRGLVATKLRIFHFNVLLNRLDQIRFFCIRSGEEFSNAPR